MSQQGDTEGTLTVGAESFAPEPDQIPIIDGYRFLEEVGAGAFGVVWRGVRSKSGPGQSVAIKLVRKFSKTYLSSLRVELERLSALSEQASIVNILDADLEATLPYLVMPYFDRGSLADVKHIDSAEALAWICQIASALEYTHAQGFLHCDLKPSNVLLGDDGYVRLTDFGQSIAQTDRRVAWGTLGYMAPEQARTGDSSPSVAWDVFGFGSTCYRVLSSRTPRLTPDDLEQLASSLPVDEKLTLYRNLLSQRPLVPLGELVPEVNPDLGDLIDSCLSLDPAERPESFQVINKELARIQLQEATASESSRLLRKRGDSLFLRGNAEEAYVCWTSAFAKAPDLWRLRLQLQPFEKPLRGQILTEGEFRDFLPCHGDDAVVVIGKSELVHLEPADVSGFRSKALFRPTRGTAYWTDGRKLVTVENARTIVLWDLDSGKRLFKKKFSNFGTSTRHRYHICFETGEELIVFQPDSLEIKQFSHPQGVIATGFTGIDLFTVVSSQDGRTLITCLKGDTGKNVSQEIFEVHLDTAVLAGGLIVGGNQAGRLVGWNDGVRMYDLMLGVPIDELLLAPDETSVAVLTGRGVLIVDVRTGRLQEGPVPKTPGSHVVWMGHRLVTRLRDDLWIWERSGEATTAQLQWLDPSHPSETVDILAPLRAAEPRMLKWAETGWSAEESSGELYDMSPCRERLAVAAAGLLRLYRLPEMKLLNEVSTTVRHLAFLNTGQLLTATDSKL